MRVTRFTVASILVGAVLCIAASAQALTIDLYGTGLDDNHQPLAAGVPDTHYAVSTAPGSVAVPRMQTYPLNGTWSLDDPVPATLESQWIAPLGTVGFPVDAYDSLGFPIGSTTEMTHPVGLYVFKTTFTLPPEVFLPGFHVEGQWMMDNFAVDILVNGISTGISRGRERAFLPPPAPPGTLEPPSADNVFQYLSFSPFLLDDSNSQFKTGLNTLEFLIQNSGCCNPQGNPVGLRVAMESYYVPEAPAVLLVGMGVAVLALVTWRRRRALAR